MDGQLMRPWLIADALRLAAEQLTDRRILWVLGLSLALTVLLTAPIATLFLALAWLIEKLTPASLHLPWLGDVRFLGIFTQGLFTRAGWIFWTYVMSPLAGGIMGLFLERVVDAVEARHYPTVPPLRHRGIFETVLYALRFFGLMVLVSLAALIASLILPWAAPVLFVAANGYLIAREYFETVALRRLDIPTTRALEQANMEMLWLLGAILALGLMVPFFNLLVPLLGIAAFTHMFYRLDDGTPPRRPH